MDLLDQALAAQREGGAQRLVAGDHRAEGLFEQPQVKRTGELKDPRDVVGRGLRVPAVEEPQAPLQPRSRGNHCLPPSVFFDVAGHSAASRSAMAPTVLARNTVCGGILLPVSRDSRIATRTAARELPPSRKKLS